MTAALGRESSFPIEEHVVGIRGGVERNVVRAADGTPPADDGTPPAGCACGRVTSERES